MMTALWAAVTPRPQPEPRPFVLLTPHDVPRKPVWLPTDRLPIRKVTVQVENATDLTNALKECQMTTDGNTMAAVVKLNDQVDWVKVFSDAGAGQKQSVTLFVPDNASTWYKVTAGNKIGLDYSPEQRQRIPQASAQLRLQWELAQEKAQQGTDAAITSQLQVGLKAAAMLRVAYDRLAEDAAKPEIMLDADAPAYLLSGMTSLTTVLGDVASGKTQFTNVQLQAIERQSRLVSNIKPTVAAEFLKRKDVRRVPIHVITKDNGIMVPDLEIMCCNQMSYELGDRSGSFSFDRQTSPATRTLPPYSYCIWAVNPKTKAVRSPYKVLDVQQAHMNDQGVYEVELEVVDTQP